MPAVLDIALALAAEGFPVFPCSRNKRPAVRGGAGFHDAVTDPAEVCALFARAPHAAMVGVPTGEVTGFDVLDIDYRNGGGLWELDNLKRLPETRIHRTPGLGKNPGDPAIPGRHYVFRHADGVQNAASKIAPGIDIRGTGGYVCFPPSGGYSVEADADVVDWPDWLLELVLGLKVAAPEVIYQPADTKLTDARLEGLRKALVRRVSTAPDGAKHYTLRNAALSMGGIVALGGISDATAIDMLMAALPQSAKDRNLAAKTAAWGIAHGRERPLELPDREAYRPRFNGHASGATGPVHPRGNGHLPPDLTIMPDRDPADVADAQWKMTPEEAQAEAEAAAKQRAAHTGITTLGYHNDVHYYLGRDTRRVFILKAEAHGRRALTDLAGLQEHWEQTRFLNEKTGQVMWEEAAADLISRSKLRGWFDPDRVRGRGAWLDLNRAVLNLGDRLVIDGKPAPLALPGSRFIYPSGLRLSLGLEDAVMLNNAEAHALVEVCNGPRWERPISGQLFAGWIVCALVCGALRWRPHVWLTGASGSGKSWLMEQVVTPLLGPMALNVLSKTTEAGLRQTLGHDALPVIFDEFEQDERDTGRVQAVLDLIRQASSESGARIIKGTTSHLARSFRTRSAFCLSSINTALSHMADESRFSVLSLLPPVSGSTESQVAFDTLQAQRDAVITADYPTRLLARVVNLLPSIIANSETFARVISRKFGTRRTGDQLGALLAGVYALHATGRIDPVDAEAWVAKQDWGEATAGATERDEVRLLQYLLAHRFSMTPEGRPMLFRTIGELIGEATAPDQFDTFIDENGVSHSVLKVPFIDREVAKKELGNHGFKVAVLDPGGVGVCISTNHPALARILKDKPAWNTAWARALKRLPRASAAATQRFGSHPSKCIWMPMSTIDNPH